MGHSPAQRPRQAGQRCPAAERNDPADRVDCGAGADGHGQRGQVRAPSSGSEPRPTQNRKRPRTLRLARIPICGPLSGWDEDQLRARRKGHRSKVMLARRLRQETTMSLKWIAARLQMGTWTCVSNLLNEPPETQPQAQEGLPLCQ